MHLIRPRCDEVRAAETRQEVVQGLFVRQVDHGETDPHLRLAAVEHVVRSEAEIEDVPRSHARWIVEDVAGARGGNAEERRADL